MNTRALILSLWCVALTACPAAKKCDATSCAGCCDTTGACVTATTDGACGAAGAQCAPCAAGLVCQGGACAAQPTGGGAGGGVGGGGGTAVTGYLEAYRDVFTAYCGWQVRCTGLPAAQQSACLDSTLQGYQAGAIAEAQWKNLGLVGPLLTHFSACARGFEVLACDTASSPADCEWLSAVGAETVVGLVPTGGSCFSLTLECASELDACLGATCPRTCRTVDLGGNGEPCTRLRKCDAGLYCDADLLCQAARAVGALCTGDELCQSGACQGGVCVALPAVGAPCLPSPPSCGAGAYCGAGNLCATQRLNGAACTNLVDECASPLRCDDNLCRTPGGVGAACGTASRLCRSDLTCDRVLRTCQASTSGALGAACTNGASWCTIGACLGVSVNADGGIGQQGTCGIPQVGSPCVATSGCPQRTFCDGSGHCAAAQVGSDCSSNANCRGVDYCVGATHSCSPRFATGNECDSMNSDSCLSVSDRCTRSPADPLSRCRPAAIAGEACANNTACLGYLRCVNSACAVVGHPGEPCLSGRCFTGACQADGGCSAPLPAGEACTGYSQCATSACIEKVCGSCP